MLCGCGLSVVIRQDGMAYTTAYYMVCDMAYDMTSDVVYDMAYAMA